MAFFAAFAKIVGFSFGLKQGIISYKFTFGAAGSSVD